MSRVVMPTLVDLGLPVQWFSFSNIEPYSKPTGPPFLLADPESFSKIPSLLGSMATSGKLD